MLDENILLYSVDKHLNVRYILIVHVISRKKILDFITQYPASKPSLESWFKILSKSEYKNFSDLKRTFPSADQVSNLTIFNIAGNKFRLIAAIHYNRDTLYIRQILTHVEYAKNKWRK